jgi:hypothetical protein
MARAVIDLTQSLNSNVPVYPGDPPLVSAVLHRPKRRLLRPCPFVFIARWHPHRRALTLPHTSSLTPPSTSSHRAHSSSPPWSWASHTRKHASASLGTPSRPWPTASAPERSALSDELELLLWGRRTVPFFSSYHHHCGSPPVTLRSRTACAPLFRPPLARGGRRGAPARTRRARRRYRHDEPPVSPLCLRLPPATACVERERCGGGGAPFLTFWVH